MADASFTGARAPPRGGRLPLPPPAAVVASPRFPSGRSLGSEPGGCCCSSSLPLLLLQSPLRSTSGSAAANGSSRRRRLDDDDDADGDATVASRERARRRASPCWCCRRAATAPVVDEEEEADTAAAQRRPPLRRDRSIGGAIGRALLATAAAGRVSIRGAVEGKQQQVSVARLGYRSIAPSQAGRLSRWCVYAP